MFISTFKSFSNHKDLQRVKNGDFQTVMPWSMYAGLKETDLNAMFIYLQTLKPIKNEIIKFKKNNKS